MAVKFVVFSGLRQLCLYPCQTAPCKWEAPNTKVHNIEGTYTM